MDYFKLPMPIVQDPNLKTMNDVAICAYIYNMSKAGEKTGKYCYATNKKIGEYTKTKERTVSDIISRLKELGYITELEIEKGKRTLKFNPSQIKGLVEENDSSEPIFSNNMDDNKGSKICEGVSKNCEGGSQNLRVGIAKSATNYIIDYINDYIKDIFIFNLFNKDNIILPSKEFINKHEQLINNLINQFYVVVNADSSVIQEQKDFVKNDLGKKFFECLLVYFGLYEKKCKDIGEESIHTNGKPKTLFNAAKAIYDIIKKPDSYMCTQFDFAVSLYFGESWESLTGKQCDYKLWHFTNARILSSISKALDKYNNSTNGVVNKVSVERLNEYGGTYAQRASMMALDALIASLDEEGEYDPNKPFQFFV